VGCWHSRGIGDSFLAAFAGTEPARSRDGKCPWRTEYGDYDDVDDDSHHVGHSAIKTKPLCERLLKYLFRIGSDVLGPL
jgi:hypothetical protein